MSVNSAGTDLMVPGTHYSDADADGYFTLVFATRFLCSPHSGSPPLLSTPPCCLLQAQELMQQVARRQLYKYVQEVTVSPSSKWYNSLPAAEDIIGYQSSAAHCGVSRGVWACAVLPGGVVMHRFASCVSVCWSHGLDAAQVGVVMYMR